MFKRDLILVGAVALVAMQAVYQVKLDWANNVPPRGEMNLFDDGNEAGPHAC
ncbi:MAG: hypothetical protein LBT58_01775 [Endomicrobium sp.]|jgi:hypothetical protein|nr:hypothetical protein [Endomicrobium sp.]